MNAPAQIELTSQNVTKYRKNLRDKLMADKLLGLIGDEDLTIELGFSGSGDSGSWDDTHKDEAVQHMFNFYLDKHVTWDWYNNDGGAGNITWDVVKNEITINGYYNVTEQVDQPERKFDSDGKVTETEPEEAEEAA